MPDRRDLPQAELFEGLSPEDVDSVLSRSTWRALPRGSFLYHQGDPAKTMFLLQSGRVRLYEITDDGREVLVTFIYPGEVFGAIIAGDVYRATTQADTPVEAYTWAARELHEFLARFPRLQRNLFALATRFIYWSRNRYRLLATAPAERRIGWALAQLAERTGRAEGSGIVIAGRTLQRDLADLASTTIYTVNRELGSWEKDGALRKQRGRIVLLRPFREADFL